MGLARSTSGVMGGSMQMKLTLVSVYVKGQRYSKFMYCEYDADGRCRLPANESTFQATLGQTLPYPAVYDEMLGEMGYCGRGITFTPGG